MRPDDINHLYNVLSDADAKPRSWFWYGRFEGATGGWCPPDGWVACTLYWLGHVVGRAKVRLSSRTPEKT